MKCEKRKKNEIDRKYYVNKSNFRIVKARARERKREARRQRKKCDKSWKTVCKRFFTVKCNMHRIPCVQLSKYIVVSYTVMRLQENETRTKHACYVVCWGSFVFGFRCFSSSLICLPHFFLYSLCNVVCTRCTILTINK